MLAGVDVDDEEEKSKKTNDEAKSEVFAFIYGLMLLAFFGSFMLHYFPPI